MSLSVKLSKGLDIKVDRKSGAASSLESPDSAFYGVKPVDFPGLIPKLECKAGR